MERIYQNSSKKGPVFGIFRAVRKVYVLLMCYLRMSTTRQFNSESKENKGGLFS